LRPAIDSDLQQQQITTKEKSDFSIRGVVEYEYDPAMLMLAMIILVHCWVL
jgi:hypothetical protein